MKSSPLHSRIHTTLFRYLNRRENDAANCLAGIAAANRRTTVKRIDEPPSCSSNLVIIGRNSRGNWVAQEQNGLFGGLFVNRAQAMKYALFENGDHPATIVLTTNVVELDLHCKASPSPQTVEADESSRQDRAA
jgi:hypothetical protein